MNEAQLTTTNPFALQSFEDLDRMAKYVAESGMFGITKPAQAICLFAICQSEGISPFDALRQYHLIDGKPSVRADAMLAKFLANNGVAIWHVRANDMAAATFFADKTKVDDAARARAINRFGKLWTLSALEAGENTDPQQRSKLMLEISALSVDGEETVIKTFAEMESNGIAIGAGDKVKANWSRFPKQMLTARVITEGIRLIAPGLITGIYETEEVRDFAELDRPARTTQVDSDRVAIEAMMNQHILDAKIAKTPERRQHYFGLAAELRCKLADMDVDARAAKPPESKSAVSTLESDQTASGGQGPVKEQASEPVHAEVLPPEPSDWRSYTLQHVQSAAYAKKKLGDIPKDLIPLLYEKRGKPNLACPVHGIAQEADFIKQAYEFHFGGGK